MQVKKTLIDLLVAAVLLFPWMATAQTSSINAFSPYTMYGIGETNTPGTLAMRSMGGAGVAMRNAGVINLLNPASYSIAPQKTFLFNFGVEGQNYYNSQAVDGATKKSAYNTFNFHDVAFQMPITRKLGLGFSLTPYSSVGYRMKYYHDLDPTDPVAGNVGLVQYNYEGEGDVTEVKLGIGWELFKNFSIGLAAQYYWGDIDRSFVMTPMAITGSGTYISTTGSDNYSISSIKGQIGVQWMPILNQKRVLSLGAAFDFGGDLSPKVTKKIVIGDLFNSIVKDDASHLPMVLPRQLTVGATYQTSKWILGLDYTYQNWGGRNKDIEYTGVSGAARTSYEVAYANTNTVKAGVEFVPNRYDVRHGLKRWSYRAGFRYGNSNQTFDGHKLGQYAATLGLGIPVKFFSISMIDVGVEYGRRGYNVADRLGLVRQQYFKFALGFTLFASGAENKEYWFMRPKYD